MTPPGQSAWQLVESGLYELVKSACPPAISGGAPNGVLAVQPNPDGTTGIQLLSLICPPQQAVFPSIGIMCTDADDNPVGVDTDESIMLFDIIVSTEGIQDASIPDTGNAALQSLKNYQNDALGNGIEPLLRANSTIFDLCQWSFIKKMRRRVLVTEDVSASAIAVAWYTIEAHMNLRAFA